MLIETQVPQIPPIANHGALTGLGNDDHTQYLLADGMRNATEITIGGSAQMRIYGSGSDAYFDAGSGDIYLDTATKVYISGDLDLTGNEITMSYGGLRIRSNGTNYNAEYDNWDSQKHIFQYQGSERFRVQADGICIMNDASLIMNGSDLEIWGGMGDIVLFPYDNVVVNNLLAPDGISFDTSGTETISSSTGDMYYYAFYGHTFYGDELQSMGGFMSSGGSPGVDETVPTADGDLYFEDGLLVYYSLY